MLQDEAVWDLLMALEAESHATLRVTVDHGEYQAFFAAAASPLVGEPKSTLTDALVSLAEMLNG